MLPIEVEIDRNSIYSFIHSRYETQTISGQEILDAGTDTWNVDMGDRFHEIKFIGLGNVGSIYIDGDIQNSNRVLRPSGTYTIVMEEPGYQNQEITLDLQQDEKLRFVRNRFYSIQEIPEGVLSVKLDGQNIATDDQFYIEDNQTVLSLVMEGKQEDYFLSSEASYFRDEFIDLKELMEYHVTLDTGAMPSGLQIEGDWLTLLSGGLTLAMYFELGYGLEGSQLPEVEANRIVKNPMGIFPDVSIAEPAEELFGAQIIMETSAESLTVNITKEYVEENLRTYHRDWGSYPESDLDAGTVQILDVARLDFGAPFHEESCQVRLMKDGVELDKQTFSVIDVQNPVHQNTYSLYDQPRDSFFQNDAEDPNGDEFYFYASVAHEDQYLVIYQVDESSSYNVPILVAKLENIDDTPIVIGLSGSARSGLYKMKVYSSIGVIQKFGDDFQGYGQSSIPFYGSQYY